MSLVRSEALLGEVLDGPRGSLKTLLVDLAHKLLHLLYKLTERRPAWLPLVRIAQKLLIALAGPDKKQFSRLILARVRRMKKRLELAMLSKTERTKLNRKIKALQSLLTDKDED